MLEIINPTVENTIIKDYKYGIESKSKGIKHDGNPNILRKVDSHTKTDIMNINHNRNLEKSFLNKIIR